MKKVQVVDDNPALRAVACAHVGLADDLQLVAEAADGVEAVTAARLHRPDAILLDLDMPVMGGFEALPLLMEVVPDASIVIYTSLDCSEARARAARLGARAYVVKGQTMVSEVMEVLRKG